jgi:hypothetical protein
MAKVLVNLGELAVARNFGTPLTETIAPHLAATRATFPRDTTFELQITNSIGIKTVDLALLQDAYAAFEQLLTLPPPPPAETAPGGS